MAELNTYGLKPLKWWKLFEVEGWQVLVSVEEDEEREGRFGVRISTAFDALGDVTSITLSAEGREFAERVFDEMNDGPKALQMILDQAGPLVARMAQ